MRTVNLVDSSEINSFAESHKLATWNEVCGLMSKEEMYPMDGSGTKDYNLEDMKEDLSMDYVQGNEDAKKIYEIFIKFMEENKVTDITLTTD
jgi:hypothetical protein